MISKRKFSILSEICLIIFSFGIFLLFSCANSLNEKNSDKWEELAGNIGLTPDSGNSGKTSNDGNNTSAETNSISGTVSGSEEYYIYTFYASSYNTYYITWTTTIGTLNVSAGTDNSSNSQYYFSMTDISGKSVYPKKSGLVYLKLKAKNSSTCSFKLTVTCSGSCSLTLYEHHTASSSSGSGNSGTGTYTPTSTTLTLGNCHTTDISDYKEEYVSAGSTKSYTFTVSSGYILNLQYYDSKNDSYVSICADNHRTAGTASPKVYKNNSLFDTITSTGHFKTTGDGSGSYKIEISPTTSGYIALRAYVVPTSYKVNSTITVQTGAGTSYTDLTSLLFSSSTTVSYQKFYATKGRTYRLRWYDSETKQNSSIYSSLSYTDGIAWIYCSDTGETELFADDTEFNSFTAENSGYYILAVSKAYSSVENNYVRYRLYTD